MGSCAHPVRQEQKTCIQVVAGQAVGKSFRGSIPTGRLQDLCKTGFK